MSPHEVLARAFAWSLMRSYPPFVSVIELESDGRKRPRVLAELRKGDYLKDKHQGGAVATSKAWDDVIEAQPSEVELNPGVDLRHATERPDGTPVAELKWVLTHQEDYAFFLVREHSVSEPEPVMLPVQAMDRTVRFISKKALAALLVRQEEARVAELMRQNIPWALEEVLGFSEADAKRVVLHSDGPFGRTVGALPKDVSQWTAAEFFAAREAIAAEVIKLQIRAQVLAVVEQQVESLGGTQAFAAKYREKVIAAEAAQKAGDAS